MNGLVIKQRISDYMYVHTYRDIHTGYVHTYRDIQREISLETSHSVGVARTKTVATQLLPSCPVTSVIIQDENALSSDKTMNNKRCNDKMMMVL